MLPRGLVGSHDFIATDSPKPSTFLVSDGAMIPSSHNRADEKYGVPSCSILAFSLSVLLGSLRIGQGQGAAINKVANALWVRQARLRSI